MKILLIHSKTEVREMLHFSLEGTLGATTVVCGSEAEAIASLGEKAFTPDFVVIENIPENLQILQNTLKNHPIKAKLILCDNAETAEPDSIPGMQFLGFALNDAIVKNLTELIKANTDKVETKLSDYCRINTALLLRLNPLAADIFIRLSLNHHVKLFQKNDVFNNEDLASYRDRKKVEYLYLKNEDCPLLVGKLGEELDRMLKMEPPPPKESTDATVENTVETIHELIDKFGVTEEVQKVVKNTVAVALKSIGDFPALNTVIKQLKDNQGTYIGKHSMLLANIACALAVSMEWISEGTFEKLTMAAFMHDSPIQDNDLCAVKDLSEFEKKYKGKFSLSQVQAYKGHPEKALLLLGQFKDLPAEVDKIILQHHEHPMGSGFPNQLSGNYITPLSALFIVAHDLTDYVLEHEGKFDVMGFFEIYEKKYSTGNFKKVAKSIASATFD